MVKQIQYSQISALGAHGVNVAEMAAAETNNGIEGIDGVDWNARIHPQYFGEDFVDVHNAIIAAVNYSPNVVVLYHSYALGHDDEIGDNPLTVSEAFAYAYKANRTSVVAMGNHHDTQPNVVAYPAGYDNVIAVGASTISDGIWIESSRGSHIDVVAPGVDTGYGAKDFTWSGLVIDMMREEGILNHQINQSYFHAIPRYG